MKVFQLKRSQALPVSMDEAWAFFSTPANLQEITPPWLGFTITSELPETVYAGLIITYHLKFYGLIPASWTTEITHVTPYRPEGPNMFVDEQRFGPYAFWHHQHHFRVVPDEQGGGTEVIDIIHYALPLGWLGEIGQFLLVRHQLEEIFQFRQQTLTRQLGLGHA